MFQPHIFPHMVTPTMFPVDKKWWSTQFGGADKCINSFDECMLSHNRWLCFFFGHLRVPTRRCDLVVPADWGWGGHSRVELTCWARSTLKKSGSYIFYQMIHFMVFLDSSHQAGSNCCFKILIIPIFDQVRRHKRKTNFRGPEVGTWLIWALASPNKSSKYYF